MGDENKNQSKFWMFRNTLMVLFGQYKDFLFINDDNQDETDSWNILIFVVFIILVLLLNIILMNILIALVGQTFDDIISI